MMNYSRKRILSALTFIGLTLTAFNVKAEEKMPYLEDTYFEAAANDAGRLFVSENPKSIATVEIEMASQSIPSWNGGPVSRVILKGSNIRMNDQYDRIESNLSSTFIFVPSRRWYLAKLIEYGLTTPARGFSKYSEIAFNSASFYTTAVGSWAWWPKPERQYHLDFRYVGATRIENGNYLNASVIPGYHCLFDGVTYDFADFGNLFWGAAMNWLGFGLETSRVGANINELMKKGHHLDADGDQRAIIAGHTRLAAWLFQGFDRKLSLRENYRHLYGNTFPSTALIWNEERRE